MRAYEPHSNVGGGAYRLRFEVNGKSTYLLDNSGTGEPAVIAGDDQAHVDRAMREPGNLKVVSR